MILTALVLGGLGLYYFGIRAGAWTAAVTLVLCVVAMVVPSLERAIHVAIAIGAVALWQVGSRRPRPPDAVLAVRLVRRGVGRAWSLVRGKRDDDRR
jgi:MFS superfamily sulfate permease-like transporter